ncbi:CoA ester lyase [Methylocapsa sp. S129]|uniref:HpcH/HpaI aldolase/citrate lyase family protein n=1 Tax=Methylocapsa sp. S129 TaxID=1641869 RepID=UPI00131C4D62|nr:CoA ester lyase [Methylocapsa sp. S129]
MHLSRSFLFVPGDRPDRFDKAAASGAHQVILDLEDAVRPSEKDKARAAIASWDQRAQAIVRINGSDSPWFESDLDFVRRLGLSKLMIPKAEPKVVRTAAAGLGSAVEIVGLIETVSGLLQIREICQEAQVRRLAFGNLDFALDAGVTETDRELDPVRLQLTLESKFSQLAPPVDGVFAAFSDTAALATRVQRAKALGLGGKLCIHPSQVASVNNGFLPDAEEFAWARRVIEGVETTGAGAISVDGKMVDRPVMERARAILRAGQQINLEK